MELYATEGVRLSRMDWWHSPPPLRELTLDQAEDNGRLFDLLRSLGGSLERLCLAHVFAGADLAKQGELVLPKLSHLYVSRFDECSTSLLGSLGFLAPNLQMLKVVTLNVFTLRRGARDGEQNGPGFSYVDLAHYCTKLRYLNVKQFDCFVGKGKRVDPPLQLQSDHPTLEIVAWPVSYYRDEFELGLRPSARIQGSNVNLLEASGGEGPVLVTKHLSFLALFH